MNKRNIPLIVSLLFLLSFSLFAQPDPEPGPIDGGVLWLVLAGLIYGASRLKKKKQS